jgi:hypothetical protein
MLKHQKVRQCTWQSQTLKKEFKIVIGNNSQVALIANEKLHV